MILHGHTIKPGTPEYETTEQGTPAEHWSTGGTPKYWAEQSEYHRIVEHETFISRGIRVRIPQELDVVVFWSWNLDVVVF